MKDAETGATGRGRAWVVLGMHRSGTSLLSHALSMLDASQPVDVMPPAADNPAGFWEPVGVCRLNEAVLSAAGSSWHRPGPWVIAGAPTSRGPALDEWLIETWSDAATEVLAKSYPVAGDIVLKDPRISLFPALWGTALARAGYQPHWLVSYRNPEAVAASLHSRSGMRRSHAGYLWQAYNLASLHADPAVEVVNYDRFVARPTDTLTRLAAHFGAAVPHDLADRLNAVVTASLNHYGEPAGEIAADFSDDVRLVWKLLEDWNGIGDGEKASRLAAFVGASPPQPMVSPAMPTFVRVQEGAFGAGVPPRDVYVSAERSLVIGGVRVAAGDLVNHVTCAWCAADSPETFHLEYDPAEVYEVYAPEELLRPDLIPLDLVRRFADWRELPPFVADRGESGQGADAIAAARAQVWAFATELGYVLVDDVDLRLKADGETILPTRQITDRFVFDLASRPRTLRLQSNILVPEADTLNWDYRKLGVSFGHLKATGQGVSLEISCDYPGLSRGFHTPEPGHRWTDGDAELPAELLTVLPDGPISIEIELRMGKFQYVRPPALAAACEVAVTR